MSPSTHSVTWGEEREQGVAFRKQGTASMWQSLNYCREGGMRTGMLPSTVRVTWGKVDNISAWGVCKCVLLPRRYATPRHQPRLRPHAPARHSGRTGRYFPHGAFSPCQPTPRRLVCGISLFLTPCTLSSYCTRLTHAPRGTPCLPPAWLTGCPRAALPFAACTVDFSTHTSSSNMQTPRLPQNPKRSDRPDPPCMRPTAPDPRVPMPASPTSPRHRFINLAVCTRVAAQSRPLPPTRVLAHLLSDPHHHHHHPGTHHQYASGPPQSPLLPFGTTLSPTKTPNHQRTVSLCPSAPPRYQTKGLQPLTCSVVSRRGCTSCHLCPSLSHSRLLHTYAATYPGTLSRLHPSLSRTPEPTVTPHPLTSPRQNTGLKGMNPLTCSVVSPRGCTPWPCAADPTPNATDRCGRCCCSGCCCCCCDPS